MNLPNTKYVFQFQECLFFIIIFALHIYRYQANICIVIGFQLFNPVVQMYDVNTWPSSLRLLSPIHIVILMVISLAMAISGLILYPSGYTFIGAMCLLISFVITGGLAALAASVISKNKGAHGLNRLKLRA